MKMNWKRSQYKRIFGFYDDGSWTVMIIGPVFWTMIISFLVGTYSNGGEGAIAIIGGLIFILTCITLIVLFVRQMIDCFTTNHPMFQIRYVKRKPFKSRLVSIQEGFKCAMSKIVMVSRRPEDHDNH